MLDLSYRLEAASCKASQPSPPCSLPSRPPPSPCTAFPSVQTAGVIPPESHSVTCTFMGLTDVQECKTPEQLHH